MSVEFWQSDAAIRHVCPANDQWPEGADVAAWLAEISERTSVFEFGCGTGRAAVFFKPGRYRGGDINPASLARARTRCPHHPFEVMDAAGPLPSADAYLCHATLLHIPDADLDGVIARFNADRVFVSEIMGKRWRREDGVPPAYNRDADDYCEAFGRHGFAVITKDDFPCRRYKGSVVSCMEFAR